MYTSRVHAQFSFHVQCYNLYITWHVTVTSWIQCFRCQQTSSQDCPVRSEKRRVCHRCEWCESQWYRHRSVYFSTIGHVKGIRVCVFFFFENEYGVGNPRLRDDLSELYKLESVSTATSRDICGYCHVWCRDETGWLLFWSWPINLKPCCNFREFPSKHCGLNSMNSVDVMSIEEDIWWINKLINKYINTLIK